MPTQKKLSTIDTLPVNFNLAEFKKATPIDESNIWTLLLERNGDRIGVKRHKSAIENIRNILLSTFRLANRVGFHAMSLRDLSTETGLSMGGLYGYIESKDQLASMIEDMEHHVMELMLTWFAHIPAPLDRLESTIRAFIYLSDIFQPWLYFVFLESRSLQLAQRDIAKSTELVFQEHIATLLKETGRFSGEDHRLFAAHCMSLVQDWPLKRWKYRAAGIDADRFADSIIRLIRTYIGTQHR
ncbi:MAG TPA: TetR/AcrR family transcriptional regulator [Rhodocyclaceae bacterium]|nr:TetR/AcrR family transcriptional regulator [Rhodocyclaceae bacterium]